MFKCERGSRLRVKGFLGKFFKINAGTGGSVTNIAFDSSTKIMSEDLYLVVNCSKSKGDKGETISFEYFSIESGEVDPANPDQRSPMYFYVILDIYSKTINNLIKGSSLIAFYLGIVLLVGFKIKAALEVKLENIKYITIVENRFLLTLIESIEIARADKNFVKEKLLFIYLLEILRSENLFNKISGSLNPSKYKQKFDNDFNQL